MEKEITVTAVILGQFFCCASSSPVYVSVNMKSESKKNIIFFPDSVTHFSAESGDT